MNLTPQWISFIVALLISTFVVLFLNFIPNVGNSVLLGAGASSFVSAFLIVFYAFDIVVYKEVDKIYENVKKLKISDLSIPKVNLKKRINPLSRLNREIANYFSQKQEEIKVLKESEKYRRDFFANVSHELKTPIFAAQSYIQTLIDGAINEKEVSKRFLNKASKSLDKLEGLVSDLMTISEIESGSIKMNLEMVNLASLVKEVFDLAENKANKKEIKLVLVPDLKSCNVMADRKRMEQVLTNLVDNAINYGKNKGKVLVGLTENENSVQVSVSDDGPGIENEHLERIFERFYRIDKSRSRKTGGTGLGLAIVKHFVNAHNSQIEVFSELGRGTNFIFSLKTPNGFKQL